MTSDKKIELLANWLDLAVDMATSGKMLPPPPRKVGQAGKAWAREFCRSLAPGRTKSVQEDRVLDSVAEVRDGIRKLMKNLEQALDALEQLALAD